MSDDEDEEYFGGAYENGHWTWDENEMGLIFVSDLAATAQEDIQISSKVPTGTIEFRDDVDVIEQDVKDVALYTAPVNILSPALINMLHLPTTERFIRALIIFCQYYLQVEHEMSLRILEMQTKMRTPYCNVIERQFADNLSDLRLLIAKEYCTMLIGGGDTKKFHHMGPMKKSRSLSNKDARLFETLLRMCVQIVWLALGRKAFNQIELEVNRIFKTEIFNAVEHTLKTSYIAKMAEEQRSVLLGRCIRRDQKLNTCSPLMNEVSCERPTDYRLYGLGVIKYKILSPRLRYMVLAAAGTEEFLRENKVVLGIIGMPRSSFDTMLRPLSTGTTDTESKSSASMLVTPLTTDTNKGYRSIYCQLLDPDSNQFVYSDVVKAFVMIIDLCLFEEGTLPGIAVLLNMDKVSLSHLSRVDLTVAQQFFYFMQEATFFRLREFHFINVPSFMDNLMSMLMPFMKESLLQTVYSHQAGSDTLSEFLPIEALPKDAGGADCESVVLRDKSGRNSKQTKGFSKKNQ